MIGGTHFYQWVFMIFLQQELSLHHQYLLSTHHFMCLGQTTSKAKRWLCPKAFLGHQSCFSLCTESLRNSRALMALFPIFGAALNQQWKFMKETSQFPCSSVEITMMHILYYPLQFSNGIERYLLILFITHYMAQRWLKVD